MTKTNGINVKNREQLILDNKGLVYYQVMKLGIKPESSFYDDVASVGTIGLIKAADTFDQSKDIKFSTYALRCITNEIFMFFRKEKKHDYVRHLEEFVRVENDGFKISLGDVLEQTDSNFVEKIINQEEFCQLLSIVLNYLKSKERLLPIFWKRDFIPTPSVILVVLITTSLPSVLLV